jgi:DNA-binding response OmpR family regulator
VPAVHGFADGPSLLRHLSSCGAPRPALVLLDLHMSPMNGLELLRRLRAAGQSAPVAFLSGAAGTEERAACLAEGAVAFVTKPVAYASLVGELQALVRRVAGPAEPRS